MVQPAWEWLAVRSVAADRIIQPTNSKGEYNE
jgi:hypothetical protein